MKSIWTIFYLLTCEICFGQNLVPNPSFEQADTCPLSSIQNFIDIASPWYSARVSPNYFNTCVNESFSLWDVPRNGWGYQQPASGNAYGSIFTYGNPSGASENFREFIGVQLSSPLLIGQEYFVSFKVARATDGFYYPSTWASNMMGALFTTYHYYTTEHDPLPNFAHVYSDSVVTDTLNWTLIKGSFVPDSAYQYVILGNFFDKFNTTAIDLGTTTNTAGAFYYLDDVCVSTDSLPCPMFVGVQEPKQIADVSLFPNPFSDKLTFALADNEQTTVSLYNFLGQQVLQQPFTNSTTINTEQLAVGIYFYELRNSKGALKTGKVVKQ